jgi:hypothetical protein
MATILKYSSINSKVTMAINKKAKEKPQSP